MLQTDTALETARQQLETQLQTLQQSTTTSSSQVEILEARVRSLESQNRDTVALHEAKSAAYDRLAEELSAQHQKLVALRKQVSELEDKKQELEAGAKDVTFRENNLRQEIEQLRTNNEWFEGELKTRSADNTRFRKEKNAQIAELQRANADATQTIDSLRSKETSQAKRIEDLEQRVEQSLLRIQQLQEDATTAQSSFRAELDNYRRLAELEQNSANTHKQRSQGLMDELRDVRDQAAVEVGQLQSELDSERGKVVDYEARLAELELVVETQETQLSELRNAVHVPHTPRRGMNGGFSTPARAGSPMISTPGGSKKSGLTVTQLYADNVKLKLDLRNLEEARKKLREEFDEALGDLENLQPELYETKEENERLNFELGNISGDLQEALAAKDAARKDARKKENEIRDLQEQHKLDRQIITDVTFQNKLLLLEQRRQEEGLEAIPAVDEQFFKSAQNNQVPEELLEVYDTPTRRLLTQHLVLYKQVGDLVDQNKQLLEQVSNFTNLYEGRQAQEKLEEQRRIQQELEELREQAAAFEDKTSSLQANINSLSKERDVWRRAAQSQSHRRGGSDAGSMFEGTPPPGNSIVSLQSPDAIQNSSLFKELQKSLDIMREESVTDRATLKHQIDTLTKEIRSLQHENARLDSKHQMAQQWQDQQQHRITALESQKELLQKRLDAAQDQLASSDLKFQQVMEENVECRGQLESLERANANLKASQALWDTTRSRLEGEIKTLNEAKTLLSKSLEEKRNDYNEQTLMQASNRRLLEAKASSLEAELSNAQRKLQDEMEEHKRVTMRFELDQTDKQRKIDDLFKAANEVRQELASVRTSRDQLQARVSELQTDLRLAEERSHHSFRANGVAGSEGVGDDDGDEQTTSRMEQLNVQLADLQRDHERATEKLEIAETHMETYKNIAQEKEEQLENFIQAHDQLEQDLNRIIQEKEVEIVDLKKRVEEFSTELATTNSELSELRSTHEKEKLELTQQKESLETDIARIQTDISEYEAAMETQKQLVATQAEIANRAQADYENELAKHGETMKNLRIIREEFNKLSTEVTQYKTEAEAARLSLVQSEEHWTSIQDRQDRELREIREEKDGLNDQNKTLYGQIDTLNNTIKTLQDNRMSVAGGQADTVNVDSSVAGLQELNKSLRNDKDILQLKVNGMELEVRRVRQDLATKQEQLDRANEKLLAEQAQSQSRPSDAKFKALEESVGQLNLYRESNTTLRNDIQRLEAERNKKDKELETLQLQLQPLQARVLELEGELEFTSGQLKTVEEDRERWQKRHQDVLQRYDRIDPKELEDLKQQIETLKTERDQATQQVGEDFQERLKAAEEEAEKQKNEAEVQNKRRADVVEKAKVKMGELRTQMAQTRQEKDTALTSLASAQAELATLREELESSRRDRDEALEKANTNDVVMAEEGQVQEGDAGLSNEEKAQLEARAKEAEDRERQQANQAVALGIQLEEFKSRERMLEGQIVSHICLNAEIELTYNQAELQQRIGVLLQEAEDARKDKVSAEDQVAQLRSQQVSEQAPATTEVTSSDEIEKLKEELAAREKEVEDLRTQAEMASSIVADNEQAAANPDTEPSTDQLATEKAALAERMTVIEEREAALAEAEAELQQRKAEVEVAQLSETKPDPILAEMQRKMDVLKEKANTMLKKEKKNVEEKQAELLQKDAELKRKDEEIARLEQEVERLRSEIEQLKQAPPSSTPSSTLPAIEASEREIQDYISRTPTAMNIIKRNVQKKLEETRSAAGPASSVDQEQLIAQKVEEATASIKAEQEEKIEQAKAGERKATEMRNAAKASMAKNKFDQLSAKWSVVVTAAKETPEKPVKEVFDVASVAKPAPPAPKPEPAAPTMPAVSGSSQAQAPAPVAAVPAAPTQSTTPATTGQQQNPPMANGPAASPFVQSSSKASNFGNPFVQASQGMNQNQAVQGFQGGFAGQQPGSFGFAGQQQAQFGAPTMFPNQQQQNSRPNSPFAIQQPNMQPYQPPRGGMNTRGQSGIPRGNSGIPVAGGGRGRGGQQPMQGPNAGGQPGQQTFGRGGGAGGRGGGGGRGRGGGQQQPGSPMNPGANAFFPGGAGAKGQKRGAEDDGVQHQNQRGGKRQRGGRGGGAAGADGAAAE